MAPDIEDEAFEWDFFRCHFGARLWNLGKSVSSYGACQLPKALKHGTVTVTCFSEEAAFDAALHIRFYQLRCGHRE